MVKAILSIILVLALAGCEAGSTRSDGGSDAPRGYERFYSDAPHNFRLALASSGEPVRRGTRSERFELRDGDCGGTDCGNPRHRAEIQLLDRSNPVQVDEDTWYGWSFYNLNIPNYSRQDSLRLVFGQWTMGGGANPILRLIQLGDGEGHWDDCNRAYCVGPEIRTGDIAVQLEDLHQTLNWGKAQNDGYICRLFDMAANRGRWVDIVMNTNFSTGSDGYLRIWVNDELKCNYSGPLVSSQSLQISAKPGHRRGIFSSYTARWDTSRGGQVKPRKVVYYDEFAIGKTREDVDVRRRESLGLKVVD